MDKVKNAILNQIMQAVLQNKEEYIHAIEQAVLEFIGGITLDGHNQPVIDEVKQKVAEVTKSVKELYDLIVGVVEKYGHPEITPKP